jgi:hypothetical protein
VYLETVSLSGTDINGMPTLDMLDFVMKFRDYEIDSKDQFLDYLAALHYHHRKLRAEKK